MKVLNIEGKSVYYENVIHFNKRLVIIVKVLVLNSILITGGIQSGLYIVNFQVVVQRNIIDKYGRRKD